VTYRTSIVRSSGSICVVTGELQTSVAASSDPPPSAAARATPPTSTRPSSRVPALEAAPLPRPPRRSRQRSSRGSTGPARIGGGRPNCVAKASDEVVEAFGLDALDQPLDIGVEVGRAVRQLHGRGEPAVAVTEQGLGLYTWSKKETRGRLLRGGPLRAGTRTRGA
jgi:hypothetical protein